MLWCILWLLLHLPCCRCRCQCYYYVQCSAVACLSFCSPFSIYTIYIQTWSINVWYIRQDTKLIYSIFIVLVHSYAKDRTLVPTKAVLFHSSITNYIWAKFVESFFNLISSSAIMFSLCFNFVHSKTKQNKWNAHCQMNNIRPLWIDNMNFRINWLLMKQSVQRRSSGYRCESKRKKNYTMKKKNTIFHLLLVNGPIHGLISMSNGATEYNGYLSKSHFDILLDIVLDFLASFI